MSTKEFANDSEFRLAVNAVLDDLLDQIDELDFDNFDARITPGSLAISFDDGSVVLLSQQTPIHEIWLSANYRAWHFVHKEGLWVERDSAESMLDVLEQQLSGKFGETIQLEK